MCAVWFESLMGVYTNFYWSLAQYISTTIYHMNHDFLIFQPKHMLWVLKRTVSMRRFFCGPKHMLKIMGKKIFTILCWKLLFMDLAGHCLINVENVFFSKTKHNNALSYIGIFFLSAILVCLWVCFLTHSFNSWFIHTFLEVFSLID